MKGQYKLPVERVLADLIHDTHMGKYEYAQKEANRLLVIRDRAGQLELINQLIELAQTHNLVDLLKDWQKILSTKPLN
jgi:hypothetical protein